MSDFHGPKHFADSSIVQPMLLGSSNYKKYLESQFEDGKVYISKYVQMEIKRSCIAPFVDFYFFLDLPTIESLGDALKLWSNRFSGREIKAVTRLVADFIETHQLSDADVRDKPKTLRRLGFLIKRIELQLRRKFINIGTNTTHCARAEVPLVSRRVENLSLSEQLSEFIENFNDVRVCRSRCRVDDFIVNRFRAEVETFIKRAKDLDKPKSRENKGFVNITENLQQIIDKEGEICSCRLCGEIGDAVITLEVLRAMCLEHTDYSFDNLCESISQHHKRQPSEMEFHKTNYDISSSSMESS